MAKAETAIHDQWLSEHSAREDAVEDVLRRFAVLPHRDQLAVLAKALVIFAECRPSADGSDLVH
jgi:hypothetical protein